MLQNRLKEIIHTILKAHTDGLSEHALIRQLEANGYCFDQEGEGQNLALFRTHFLVMNALYRLQDELVSEGLYLAITPLSIRLECVGTGSTTSPTQGPDAQLRDYYLDDSQLDKITGSDVEQMLNGFWEQFLAIDKKAAALNTLGVVGDEGWPTISQAYRRLAAEHHPDRGGSQSKFVAIREAYKVLKQCYGYPT